METPKPKNPKDQPITLTSSLSPPRTCQKIDSHIIQNIDEYSHVQKTRLDDAQIVETIPHLLSPYDTF